jgi:hypothetical protein
MFTTIGKRGMHTTLQHEPSNPVHQNKRTKNNRLDLKSLGLKSIVEFPSEIQPVRLLGGWY